MTSSLDAALSGVQAHQRHIDLIANNLANVNTTAYKRANVHFQDALDGAQILAALGGTLPEEENQIASAAGVQTLGEARLFDQGALEPTGGRLDFAIDGAGFFRVQQEDGTVAYTRDGTLRLDAQRRLVTTDGLLLDPPITLPDGFRSLNVDRNGFVSVVRPYTQAELNALPPGAPTDGVREDVGRIALTRFPHPEGLESLGRNLYGPTPEALQPVDGFPGDDGMGTVLAGWLERSNVDVSEEMTSLVVALRAFQLNLNAYRTIEDMLAQANELA